MARPGSGSASRASPIGNNGDSASAVSTAIDAAVTLTIATRAIASANRSRPVMPIAPRIGESVASVKTWRPSAWPATRTTASASTAAKLASASVCGRTARATVWVRSRSALKKTASAATPCAAAVANTRRRYASTSAPERSRTTVP
jgi:hypothetical protein